MEIFLMSKSYRKNHTTNKRKSAGSLLPMSMTAGLFLGFGLGALLNSALLVTAAGILLGAIIGYRVDKNNKIPYTQRRRS